MHALVSGLELVTCPCFQEVWRDDGTVCVDGKVLQQCNIEQYRDQGSTRTRARTRGGAQIRAKAPRSHLETTFMLM